MSYESLSSPRLMETSSRDVRKIPTIGNLIIGRDPGEPDATRWAVIPAVDGVSRIHIEVFFNEDLTRVIVRDVGTDGLGSTSGTFVNGKRIPPVEELTLNHQDRVRLGPPGGVELLFFDVATYSPEDFDCRGGSVYIKGSLLPELNRAQYNILIILLENYPDSISVHDLGARAWGEKNNPQDPRTVQRAVQRLGQELNKFFDRSSPEYPSIRFVQKGYRLCLFD